MLTNQKQREALLFVIDNDFPIQNGHKEIAINLWGDVETLLTHIATLESQLAWQPIESMPDSGEGLLGQWMENPWTHEVTFHAQRVEFSPAKKQFIINDPMGHYRMPVWMHTPTPPEVL